MNNYRYLESLNLDKVRLLSLQLVNVERIKTNDIIYIFDEVGAGKTISAGLCIRYVVYQRKSVRILVITAPSVVEQFRDKLSTVLDLTVEEQMLNDNLNYEINVINFDYRNIQKQMQQYWDLIIIDEAHEFLNRRAKRYEALSRLMATKVIFMTATPIKGSMKDLDTYPLLGASLLSNSSEQLDELTKRFTNKLKSHIEDKKKLCTEFNPNLCVTRYFKETTRNIEKVEGKMDYQNTPPRRLVPEIWSCPAQKNKNDFLSEMITSLDPHNRYVIFVNRKSHIVEIQKALVANQFVMYSNSDHTQPDTFYSITGDHIDRNSLLKEFSDPYNINFPKVLILTYQIGEQGIDLPTYNYIINYHVPSSPSRIEQRFGRVDRLNSIHQELHTCFLLEEAGNDSNTINFDTAVATYVNDFLPQIPSKNSLMTKEIIQRYSKRVDYVIQYYHEMCVMADSDLTLAYNAIMRERASFEHVPVFTADKLQNKDMYKYLIASAFDGELLPIINFVIDRELDIEDSYEDFKNSIHQEAKKLLETSVESKNKLAWWMKNIDLLSDHVFYINDDHMDWIKEYEIEMIDPNEAARNIVESEEYKRYSKDIMQPMHNMWLWQKHKGTLEEFYETIFNELTHNEKWFDYLIKDFGHPELIQMFYQLDQNSYSGSIKRLIALLQQIPESEFKDLCRGLNDYIPELPFFKMRNAFRKIVHSYALTKQGNCYRTRFDFDPIGDAFSRIMKNKYTNEMSMDFIEKYKCTYPFYFSVIGNRVVASNWLKLLFVYSNKIESQKEKFPWKRSLFRVFRTTDYGNPRTYSSDLNYRGEIKKLQANDSLTGEIVTEL
ncbi:helicase-related protein [Paenibacillus filicis]|uniref:Helicase-related protein n=1 Tax=Paenibacillus gyeongsangnamensis TaxID=3388067 RepID=A0ABT4Q3K5_9BACL|nr:helicase-related protein [Paenibacillus filicis]MCZ8511459.1 helicase-related protein [Paenibacillus filicis]